MAGSLEILSAGFQSTVQDRGRWGYQEYGVPVSGMVAPHWMEIGNRLVGNEGEEAGIEFRMVGPVIRAKDVPVKIAVCGDVTSEVSSQSESGTHSRKVTGWRSFTLSPDEELKVGSIENSVAGFIAISGGLKLDPVMGSHSTYTRSAVGGFKGRCLRGGDVLELGEKAPSLACDADKVLPTPPTVGTNTLRVVLGPQEDYFEEESISDFFALDYTISKDSDRMGTRLEGVNLLHKTEKGSDIVSDGVAPGTVQIPGNGKPIILLNDSQTVGGYPKIATVISVDLPKIANALPGTSVRFQRVSAYEACLHAREEAEKMERLKKSIVAASGNGFVNLMALYELNLIGGVVDMGQPDHFPGHLEGDE